MEEYKQKNEHDIDAHLITDYGDRSDNNSELKCEPGRSEYIALRSVRLQPALLAFAGQFRALVSDPAEPVVSSRCRQWQWITSATAADYDRSTRGSEALLCTRRSLLRALLLAHRLPLPETLRVHNGLRTRLQHHLHDTSRAEAAHSGREPNHLALNRLSLRIRRSSRTVHRSLPARHHRIHIDRHVHSNRHRSLSHQSVRLALYPTHVFMRHSRRQYYPQVPEVANHLQHKRNRCRSAPIRARLFRRE